MNKVIVEEIIYFCNGMHGLITWTLVGEEDVPIQIHGQYITQKIYVIIILSCLYVRIIRGYLDLFWPGSSKSLMLAWCKLSDYVNNILPVGHNNS